MKKITILLSVFLGMLTGAFASADESKSAPEKPTEPIAYHVFEDGNIKVQNEEDKIALRHPDVNESLFRTAVKGEKAIGDESYENERFHGLKITLDKRSVVVGLNPETGVYENLETEVETVTRINYAMIALHVFVVLLFGLIMVPGEYIDRLIVYCAIAAMLLIVVIMIDNKYSGRIAFMVAFIHLVLLFASSGIALLFFKKLFAPVVVALYSLGMCTLYSYTDSAPMLLQWCTIGCISVIAVWNQVKRMRNKEFEEDYQITLKDIVASMFKVV